MYSSDKSCAEMGKALIISHWHLSFWNYCSWLIILVYHDLRNIFTFSVYFFFNNLFEKETPYFGSTVEILLSLWRDTRVRVISSLKYIINKFETFKLKGPRASLQKIGLSASISSIFRKRQYALIHGTAVI